MTLNNAHPICNVYLLSFGGRFLLLTSQWWVVFDASQLKIEEELSYN